MTKKAAKLNIQDDPDAPERWSREGGRTERIVLTTDDELDEILADSPQNEACIELSRINAQGGRPAFLEDMMPSNFSYGYVTKTYGGGRYMAKAKYANGDKKKMFFEIEGDPFPVKRRLVNLDPHTPVLPNQPARVETEALPPLKGDPQDFQTAMLGIVQTMVRQTQQTEVAMLEKMKLYKELFGAGNAAPAKEAPLDQLINMFSKGVELAGRGGGGGSDESFWISIARELKDPLMSLASTVQAAITRQPAPVQVNSPGSPGIIPPANQGGPPVVQQGDPAMLTLMPVIKQVMPMLVNAATRNLDTEPYALMTLDQTPETAYPAFRDWLLKPGCLDQLALLEPGVRFQREWWEDLRGELLQALNTVIDGVTHVQPQQDSDAQSSVETAGHDLS